MDRIDIHIEVPVVPFQELSSAQAGTSSATMRESVEAARELQAVRFAGVELGIPKPWRTSERELDREAELPECAFPSWSLGTS